MINNTIVTCILSQWVAVGQSCEDIAVTYNLPISTFLAYNPGWIANGWGFAGRAGM